MRIKIRPEGARVLATDEWLRMNGWLAGLRDDGRAEPTSDSDLRPEAPRCGTAGQAHYLGRGQGPCRGQGPRTGRRAGGDRRPAADADYVVRNGFLHLLACRSRSTRGGRQPRPRDPRRLARRRPRPDGMPPMPADRLRLPVLPPSRAMGPVYGHRHGGPARCAQRPHHRRRRQGKQPCPRRPPSGHPPTRPPEHR